MKVSNMKGKNRRAIPNQFVMTEKGKGWNGNFIEKRIFQSYNSLIAKITQWDNRSDIELDEKYWNYSKTTSKYRNQFLGMTTKEIKAKIKTGEIQLVNLN